MKKREAGSGDPKPGDEAALSRRGWLGALAGVAAAVAGARRQRRETVAEKRRRRRLWIGHT